MSQAKAINALDAAADLGVSYKTVLRWATVGGSESIAGAKRVGKEWAIPVSEVERIKARRLLTYQRVRETADWAWSIERLHMNIGADAEAGLHAAAAEYLETSDPRALIEAVVEYQAWRAGKGLVDAARDLARKANV
jgi:hypothetical protein